MPFEISLPITVTRFARRNRKIKRTQNYKMSRHRDVRSINYTDECEGLDDVYGHSLEDDYSVSPSVEQFMFDRTKQSDISAYISKGKDGIAEEDENTEELSVSSHVRPQLNDIDEARLQSCLDEIRNVIGDSTPERVLIDTIVKNGFDIHRSLDAILNSSAIKTPIKGASDEQREKDYISNSLVAGLELPPPPAFDPPMSAAIDLGAALVPSMSNLVLSNSQMDNFAFPTALLPPPPPLELGSFSADVDLSSALVGPPPTVDLSLPPSLNLPPAPHLDLSSVFVQPNAEKSAPVKENIRPVKSKVKKSAHSYGINLDEAQQKADALLSSEFHFVTRKVSDLGFLIFVGVSKQETMIVTLRTPEPAKVSKAKTLSVTKGFDITPKSGQKISGLKAEPMDISPRSQSPSVESAPEKLKIDVEKEAALIKNKELRGEAAVARYNEERSGTKPLLHMVNQRTMHKYEQESKKIGKQSFMYAWILDETGEERTRGITMDIGQSRFETASKSILILDAPGHKDFIPNMISGATQADAAVLVVDAGRGEFESGFESGGQTREHALLVRSLGVSQLVVVVNKLDTAGYRDADVCFVPCSGLSGENLTKSPTEDALLKWYHGPCLVEAIDKFKIPERPISKPFRLSVNDIFKGTGTGFCVSGRVEGGSIQSGDKVLVQPQGETAVVKSITLEEMPYQVAFAGDQVTLTLSGLDMQNISLGYILCDPMYPVPVTTRIEARIVLFNLQVPITQGFPVFFHSQSLVEQAVITKLISQLHRGSGEVTKRHPRCLPKNTSAVVEVTLNRPVSLELYKDVKELGRFMLRSSGVTIAAGLVNKIY
ncbi:Hypothetical predicted protein [Cloeon dipterum]|uniref:Tr-type G domain-containing protein n=1 Tax=Cloeon dipterum TaxID=197152 RepID=A0A8S1D7Z5_9INSE|nr:Hypothetical predicted protein [Cloeon dipterum]